MIDEINFVSEPTPKKSLWKTIYVWVVGVVFGLFVLATLTIAAMMVFGPLGILYEIIAIAMFGLFIYCVETNKTEKGNG